MPRILAALAATGLSLLTPMQARADDGIFGDLLSRFSRVEEPRRAGNPEIRDREREARNLRREYWERERARIAQAGMAREVSNQAVASR
ncbi:MAG TPA: hypothetical protein VIL69_14075 [Roseomonas sp.]